MASFIEHYQQRPHEGIALYTSPNVFDGRIDAVHARSQAALDAQFAAYPELYPNGPPKGKRPPAVMAINPQDGLTALGEIGATHLPEPLSATPVSLRSGQPH